MELDDMEYYYTRKKKGLVGKEETEEYIKKLEKKINYLEQVEKKYKKENSELKIYIKKLEEKQ